MVHALKIVLKITEKNIMRDSSRKENSSAKSSCCGKLGSL
jgi:hypothetical protein